MALDNIERQNMGFLWIFDHFGLRDTF